MNAPLLEMAEATPLLYKLTKFSERQQAVAGTWATHFSLSGLQRTRFMVEYLTSITSRRIWCVQLNDTNEGTPALLRFGDLVQYFDGKVIHARISDRSHRVPNRPPTPDAAGKLLRRLELDRWTGKSALLTTFCEKARGYALQEAMKDLGSFGLSYTVSREGRNNRFFGPRMRFYLSHMGGTLKRFCSVLDQGLLHAIRSVQCPSPQLYNWLATGNTLRRLQALKAQPVLVPLIVLSEELPQGCYVSRNPLPDGLQKHIAYLKRPYEHQYNMDGFHLLGRIVDAGLPLTDVLAWMLETPVSAIRYLGQQRVYDTGSALTRFKLEGFNSGWHMLVTGAQLGNRRPCTKKQWQSFSYLYESIPWEARSALRDMNRMIKGWPTDWAHPSWPAHRASIQDIKELFTNLNRGEHPDLMATSARFKAFISSLTGNEIASLVDSFHQALAQIREDFEKANPLSDSDSQTQWPGLLQQGAITTPEGLEIVELNCPADLTVESRTLHHCIDTYDFRGYKGLCRLLSVRDQGRPLASVEVVLERRPNEKNDIPWSVRHLVTEQIRGLRNAIPNSASAESRAYDWFIMQVQAGRIPVNLQWPDQTQTMKRYADATDSIRHSQAVAKWIDDYMKRGC
ncbi:PcfJ domain-containing protein [Pseudomonas sp. NPDC088368]|uniref:PcfJ domain-containing protein n=1 Tax=Pseudomonas sp. NPDC088368 TaxID=3364453 RepID=UPI0037F9BD12